MLDKGFFYVIIIVMITTLKENMKNYSRQREAIKVFLNNSYSHPTAEEIYAGVRLIIPNISLGTVYRNLSELVKEKEALILHIEGYKDRYDGHTIPHAHLRCVKCGKIEDIFFTKEQLDTLCLIGGDNFNLDYYNLCSDCKIK